MRLVRWAASQKGFDNNELDEYWEFRPGLNETSAESPVNEHPGFDWDHGGLYHVERSNFPEAYTDSLQSYCSLDEAREWLENQDVLEEFEVE